MALHRFLHFRCFTTALVACAAVTRGLVAAAPGFYLIERFQKFGVLVHFDIEPFRTYELQSTTNLAAATGIPLALTNAWQVVYRVDASPFSQHYILPNYFTNTTSQVFYRLKALP